jgi:uncharacterized protein (TIGR01777 family)
VVSGGTGLIGRAVVSRLLSEGAHVVVLSRSAGRAGLPAEVEVATWDAATVGPWANRVDGATAVVHLAGENLAGGLWTRRRKERILSSRVASTRVLVRAIQQARQPPQVLVQASGVSYYGARPPDEEITEEDGPGEDFLARVALAWEGASAEVESIPVRRVLLRSGLVLARSGGALPTIALPFRLGLGAVLGDGRQPFPWIHLTDEADAITYLLADQTVRGPFNLVAPMGVDNRTFSRLLARVLHRPCLFRVPAFMLRLALGEMADTVLTGQKATPKRLIECGFRFRFPTLESALAQIYGSTASTSAP